MRPLHRAAALVLAATMVLASSPPAHANDQASAQALFDQAKKLMSQERWTEACAKLEESQRLDPASGTLLHLALCREHEGRIATAWAVYQDAVLAARKDGRKDRAKIAQERVDALGPRLPKMRVKVARANRRIEGFKLLRDDVTVGEAQWDESLPVDPGPRVLVARASGRKPWQARIEVPSRPEEIVVEVPELEIEPRPDIAHGQDDKPSGTVMRLGDDGPRGQMQRTAGIVAGSLGAGAMIVGSIFGVVSIGKSKDADQGCQPPDRKLGTPTGKRLGDEAITAGNVSTVMFVVGGVLVAGGVALYFTAPSGSSSVAIAPRVGPGEAGVGLHATF